jgi:S-DNA-T family DNA segregation ATPase FtsK/SpoIIIE
MISSISRSIYKTPLNNSKSNCYENIDSNKFLSDVCQSKLISEGVYGIENFIIDDYFEDVVFTPHIYKLNSNVIEKTGEI